MISIACYDGDVQKSQVFKIGPVFETKPTCVLAGFDIYAGLQKNLDVFPLRSSRFSLLVSLRSTSFGYSTLRTAFAFASNFSDNCLLSVVDLPYRWNALAQTEPPSANEIAAEIDKLSSEVWRRIDNVASEFSNLRFDRIKWTDLCAMTPEWIKIECERAFDKNGPFSKYLKTATRFVFANRLPVIDPNIAARFLVEELPVLCWLYYASPTQYIDLYPGRPFIFFRILENKGFKTELPHLTKMSTGWRRFIHVDISQKRC